MEIKHYLLLLRRWGWLLILGLVLGAGVGFVVSQVEKPTYQGITKFLVVRSVPDKTNTAIYVTDMQLAQTYVEMLLSKPVLSTTAEQLGYKINVDNILVEQVRETQVIKVTVENSSAEKAAAIANTLVKVLIAYNDDLQSGRFSRAEEGMKLQVQQVEQQMTVLQGELTQVSDAEVQKQLKQVDGQIASFQSDITTLENEISHLDTPQTKEQTALLLEKQTRLAQVQPLLAQYQEIRSNLLVLGRPVQSSDAPVAPRQAQIQSTLNMYQQLYLSLLTNLETVRLTRLQTTPNVIHLDEAVLPKTPVRPSPFLYALIAGAVGLALGLVFGVLYDYLDTSLKTAADAETVLGVPALGWVTTTSASKEGEIYLLKEPSSPVSEAFRSLRLNLEFTGKEKPLRTLLVAEADQSGEKTIAAVNLAAAFGSAGKQVILLDADLHQPSLHSFLGLEPQPGLSDILKKALNFESVSITRDEIPSVTYLLAGSPVAAPLELLESERMPRLLKSLQQNVDIVIVIAPPMFGADMLVLASQADGVLLVFQPGHTSADTARAAMEQLTRANAKVLGSAFIYHKGRQIVNRLLGNPKKKTAKSQTMTG